MESTRQAQIGELHGTITRLSSDVNRVYQSMSFSRSALHPHHRELLDEAEKLLSEANSMIFQVGNEMEPSG